MISMDNFIQQLIRSGLAVSFLTAVKKHYLKINKAYEILCIIEEDYKEIEIINCNHEEGILTVETRVENIDSFESICEDEGEISVQANKNGDIIIITVTTNYKSEDDLYEARFARREKSNNNKWS